MLKHDGFTWDTGQYRSFVAKAIQILQTCILLRGQGGYDYVGKIHHAFAAYEIEWLKTVVKLWFPILIKQVYLGRPSLITT